MKKNEKTSEVVTTVIRRRRKARNVRPAERGLGPQGGGWNIQQASAWSGIGEANLRDMAKKKEIPCYHIGRRILIPRQGFMDWFNRLTDSAA